MEKINFGKLKKLLPGLQKNISLKNYTTFKIGGPAKYFFVARKKEDLIKAIETAKRFRLPFLVLGGGSNILFSDKGYRGMVVKYQISNSKYQKDEIYAEAGVKLDKIAKLALKESLTGLEWLAGVPGTIGGAVFGNAQAFGGRMSEIVKRVEVFDVKTLKIKSFSQKQCGFSVKNSVFKRNKDLIILSTVLRLKKGDKKEIQKRIRENLSYRRRRHPLKLASAGSIFINQKRTSSSQARANKNKFLASESKKEQVPREREQKLLKEFPELKEFNKKGVIPSAYLIEKCGLKGRKIGKAQISEKHANFIVNLGGAKAKDVIKLIKIAKQKVKTKFGINLKEEIQIIV